MGIFTAFTFFALILYWLIVIAAAVLTIIGMWKVFEKNNMEGWYAVIPGFNIWKFLELNKIPGWMMFLPGANVIYLALAYYRISIKMGKDILFAILTIFYPFVGLMILGFSQNNEVKDSKNETK